MRDLATLPKAHLHIHLEGAMRPSTLAEFAAEAGEAAPPTRGFTSFPQFVEHYDGAVAFIRTREQLARVVREVVEDAALAGAVWIEAQANPMFYVPRFGTPEEQPGFYRDLSSRAFFDRITEPVLIHHGDVDETCPFPWATTTQRLLEKAGVDSRLSVWEGEGHTFYARWEDSMEETVRFLRGRLDA